MSRLRLPFPVCLSCALIGLAAGSLAAEADSKSAPEVITTAAAVRALAVDVAAQARPVRLEGVVIVKTRFPPALILMDETEGLYVRIPDEMFARWQPGDWLEVTGTTGPGDFAPIATATSIRWLGKKPLPAPVRTTIGEVASGGFDARWIELEGIVHQCEYLPHAGEATTPATSVGSTHNTVLTLAAGDQRMRVRVDGRFDAAQWIDARVRIRGVCFNVHNANRQFVRASVWAMGADAVSILKPAPVDPFAMPVQRVADLLRFSPTGFDGHRVRVRGHVTSHQPGDALWIRDGERGLKVVSSQPGQMAPGDTVEVVGFAENPGYSPSLVDAVYRRVAPGAPPEPITIRSPAEALAHAADLVRIDADLVDVRTTPEGVWLSLAWNQTVIEAVLPTEKNQPPVTTWEPGSRLRLAGICALEPKNEVPESGLWLARDFQLRLRTPADVTVLQAAPWLNPRRTLALLSVVAVILVVGIVGQAILSRRQLRLRVAERKMAEVEFTAMLRERNRVARDIHDTLAQGLNAVSMQLELAKNAGAARPAEVLGHVATAHTIVRSCITEARESIWNMRSQVLEKTDLAGALTGVLQQLSADRAVQASLAVTGTPRRLAPMVENSLLRIGQESIANAVKHAHATTLRVELAFAGPQVRLTVADDGVGFDQAAVGTLSSRFGLAGMRERVAAIPGELTITTAPGRGTTVTVAVAQPG